MCLYSWVLYKPILAGLWEGAAYHGDDDDAEPADPARLPRSKRPKPLPKKVRLLKLPLTFEVTVPSSQENVDTVTFVVLRAEDGCLPSIELTSEAMDTLWKECDAQYRSAQEAAPSTPPVPKAKRRTSPLVRSPGSSSPRSTKKKPRAASTHHDKSLNRVQARWVDAEGLTRTKSFPIPDASDAKAVSALKRQALHHAKELQGRPAL